MSASLDVSKELYEELLALEHAFWTGDLNTFQDHVDDGCVLLVRPDWDGIYAQEDVGMYQVKDSWAEVQITVTGMLQPIPGIVFMLYEVTATGHLFTEEAEELEGKKRKSRKSCKVVANSSYVNRDGVWKLVAHQRSQDPSRFAYRK